MDPFAFIADYLSDQEDGMKKLITWFLNQAMLQEALQQAGAAQYERTDARKAHVRQEAVIWIALCYPLRSGYTYRSMHLW